MIKGVQVQRALCPRSWFRGPSDSPPVGLSLSRLRLRLSKRKHQLKHTDRGIRNRARAGQPAIERARVHLAQTDGFRVSHVQVPKQFQQMLTAGFFVGAQWYAPNKKLRAPSRVRVCLIWP